MSQTTLRISKLGLVAVLLAHASPSHAQTWGRHRGNRLVGGTVAGIILAIIAGLIVLTLLMWFCFFRSAARRRRATAVPPSGNVGLPFFASKPYGPPPGPPPPPTLSAQGYEQGYAHGQPQDFGAAAPVEDDGRYYPPPSVPPPAYTQTPSEQHATNDASFVGGFKPRGQ